MSRFTPIAFAVLLASMLCAPAQAYVSYNRLGYVSCTACHYGAAGGGLLTGYGRTVGAAMALFSAETTPPERRVYAGFQGRAIWLDESRNANPFLMQSDVLVTGTLTEKIRLDVVGGPNLSQGSSDFIDISAGNDAISVRRAMVTVNVNESDTIEAGRDLSLDGLNIDDHTSFLRTLNRRGIDDYPTQIRYVKQGEKLQLIPVLSFPSYEELEVNREYAAGARGEYLLNDRNSVGGLVSYGNSPSLARATMAVFARLSPAHGAGVMAEAHFSRRMVHISEAEIDQQIYYLRPYFSWPEWVETSLIYEYLHVSTPAYRTAYQWGPEVNVRLHEHLSLIGDGRQLGTRGTTDWSWYGQIFLHFQI